MKSILPQIFLFMLLAGVVCYGMNQDGVKMIAKQADLIVVGQFLGGVGSANWKVKFSVEQVLKGKISSKEIEIEYPPSKHSFDLMRSGDKCLIFLTRNGEKVVLVDPNNDRKSIVAASEVLINEVEITCSEQAKGSK